MEYPRVGQHDYNYSSTYTSCAKNLARTPVLVAVFKAVRYFLVGLNSISVS